MTPSAWGQEYDLESIGNTSSVAYESRHLVADWLHPSNEIPITHNRHHGPCHTGTYSDGPIHPLSPKCSGPMAFIHAPARDAHDGDRFQDDIMFIEVLVRRITAPRLEKLDLDFFRHLSHVATGKSGC